ncbi:hypothetical protein PF008_g31003, partial [Phytophthora fragariae]
MDGRLSSLFPALIFQFATNSTTPPPMSTQNPSFVL